MIFNLYRFDLSPIVKTFKHVIQLNRSTIVRMAIINFAQDRRKDCFQDEDVRFELVKTEPIEVKIEEDELPYDFRYFDLNVAVNYAVKRFIDKLIQKEQIEPYNYLQSKYKKDSKERHILWKNGVKYTFSRICDFVKEHNLKYQGVSQVLRGLISNHRGFTLTEHVVDRREKTYVITTTEKDYRGLSVKRLQDAPVKRSLLLTEGQQRYCYMPSIKEALKK